MARPTARFETDTGRCGSNLQAYWKTTRLKRTTNEEQCVHPSVGPGLWILRSRNLGNSSEGIAGGDEFGETIHFNPISQNNASNPSLLLLTNSDDLFIKFPGNNGGTRDFAWGAWINHDTLTYDQTFSCQWRTGFQVSWRLYYDFSATQYAFGISTDGSTEIAVQASTFGSPSTSTWNFVVGRYRNGTDIGISVNGSAYDTSATAVNLFQTSVSLTCGCEDNGNNGFDGEMSDLYFWLDGAPSENDLKALYNNGRGSRLISGQLT